MGYEVDEAVVGMCTQRSSVSVPVVVSVSVPVSASMPVDHMEYKVDETVVGMCM